MHKGVFMETFMSSFTNKPRATEEGGEGGGRGGGGTLEVEYDGGAPKAIAPNGGALAKEGGGDGRLLASLVP